MARSVRRLAAIVAADVVGYSRMVEADEGSTLAALKAARIDVIDPILIEKSGRIVKTMGDGFIAVFGSVVDAVGFAVAMQRATKEQQASTSLERRLVFRIGINLGDVVIEGVDLLGDGVNVAARLEQLCPPNGILVSGTAFDQLQGKLDLPVDFAGEQRVKNINRPVRTYLVRLEGSGPGRRFVIMSVLKQFRAVIALGLITAITVVGIWFSFNHFALASNPSIAVMPFESLGGDDSSDRLAHGVTSDLVVDFSRFRDIDVVATSATEAYGQKPADPRKIARDLNVRYVLKGSIQREGAAIRVNAQLLDGQTGGSLWSNRWDRPAADIFALQSEVADRVISSLGGYNFFLKQAAVASRRKPPSDLAAYDLYALAATASHTGHFAEGLKYADAAIAKDPQLARAYVERGYLVWFAALAAQNWREDAMNEVVQLARKAIEIDPYDPGAHGLLGSTLRQLGDFDQAASEIERELELNPSSADGMMNAAWSMSYLGKPEEGAAMCDQAFHLNPLPPLWYPACCPENFFFTKRFREAADAIKRTAAWKPLYAGNLGWLAAAQVELGAADDASATVAEWRQRFPDSTVEGLLSSEWLFKRKQEAEQILQSLEKANAPICVPRNKLRDLPNLKRLAFCDAERDRDTAP